MELMRVFGIDASFFFRAHAISVTRHLTQGGFTLIFFEKAKSQPRALATHTPILGRVAQGALEFCLTQIRRCHFLSDPCVSGCIFLEKAPIETFYISS